MIPITEQERIEIQKQAPQNKLAISGRGKRSGGKKYYVMEGDKISMAILAKLRKTNVWKLINMR